MDTIARSGLCNESLRVQSPREIASLNQDISVTHLSDTAFFTFTCLRLSAPRTSTRARRIGPKRAVDMCFGKPRGYLYRAKIDRGLQGVDIDLWDVGRMVGLVS